jgi:hypothetical protein
MLPITATMICSTHLEYLVVWFKSMLRARIRCNVLLQFWHGRRAASCFHMPVKQKQPVLSYTVVRIMVATTMMQACNLQATAPKQLAMSLLAACAKLQSDDINAAVVLLCCVQMAPVDYAQEGHRLLQLIQQKA